MENTLWATIGTGGRTSFGTCFPSCAPSRRVLRRWKISWPRRRACWRACAVSADTAWRETFDSCALMPLAFGRRLQHQDRAARRRRLQWHAAVFASREKRDETFYVVRSLLPERGLVSVRSDGLRIRRRRLAMDSGRAPSDRHKFIGSSRWDGARRRVSGRSTVRRTTTPDAVVPQDRGCARVVHRIPTSLRRGGGSTRMEARERCGAGRAHGRGWQHAVSCDDETIR